MSQQWREMTGADIEERIDQVSPDLPYELQSKMFDQLAATGVAGAGLTVTLIGSLLRNAPGIVWLPVICFTAAAILAISANSQLIDSLFRRRAALRRSRLHVALTVGLIGMAIGILSAAVFEDGERGSGETRQEQASRKAASD